MLLLYERIEEFRGWKRRTPAAYAELFRAVWEKSRVSGEDQPPLTPSLLSPLRREPVGVHFSASRQHATLARNLAIVVDRIRTQQMQG
jgi:hypothetical protein